MKDLPRVVEVRTNAGRSVIGSFVDPEWVLHYVAAGRWLFQAEDRLYRVAPGDMVLIPPRVLHIVQPRQGARLIQRVVHFELPALALPADLARALTLPRKSRREAARLFQELMRAWGSSSAYRATIAAGLLTVLLGIYLRHAGRPAAGEPVHSPGWPGVEKAVRYMHRHYRNPELSLGQISAAAGFSPPYLCRIFRQNTGGPVMRHLNELRIQRAGELLLRSGGNCTEVAEAVGFAGIHVFSRTFKKHTGLPPTAYRARHAPLFPA